MNSPERTNDIIEIELEPNMALFLKQLNLLQRCGPAFVAHNLRMVDLANISPHGMATILQGESEVQELLLSCINSSATRKQLNVDIYWPSKSAIENSRTKSCKDVGMTYYAATNRSYENPLPKRLIQPRCTEKSKKDKVIMSRPSTRSGIGQSTLLRRPQEWMRPNCAHHQLMSDISGGKVQTLTRRAIKDRNLKKLQEFEIQLRAQDDKMQKELYSQSLGAWGQEAALTRLEAWEKERKLQRRLDVPDDELNDFIVDLAQRRAIERLLDCKASQRDTDHKINSLYKKTKAMKKDKGENAAKMQVEKLLREIIVDHNLTLKDQEEIPKDRLFNNWFDEITSKKLAPRSDKPVLQASGPVGVVLEQSLSSNT